MSGVIAGLVLSAGATTFSFIQAGKQRRLEEDAARKAEDAMRDIEKELTKNEYEAMAIQKEPYEIAQDTLKTNVQSQINALQEGDQRGVMAGANRLNQAALQAAAEQRTSMSKDLRELDKLTADENTRKSDIKSQLALGEIQGAQKAMADAEARRSQYLQQGAMGVANLAVQGVSAIPDFQKSAAARDVSQMERNFRQQQRQDFLAGGGTRKEFRQTYDPASFGQQIGKMTFTPEMFDEFGMIGQSGGLGVGQFSDLDLAAFSSMTPQQVQLALLQMTPTQRNMIQQSLSAGTNLYGVPRINEFKR
jgi:hypothetical protein|tara:strand:+ start:19552 stop:20469 length:918 start_codon:yes stop_codon:yes gene_type:complete